VKLAVWRRRIRLPGRRRGDRIGGVSGWPEKLIVRPLTRDDAVLVGGWRYPGAWRTYDSQPENGLLSAEAGYQAVTGDGGGPLVGFCCSGGEARVPGLAEQEGVLDIGVGMDPELVGQGHGKEFGDVVLDHYRAAGATRLRAVVQSWNERSIRLTRSLGFTDAGVHRCVLTGRDVEFTILLTD
jgi:RimJ/RimL family protein N-acetyltransferase